MLSNPPTAAKNNVIVVALHSNLIIPLHKVQDGETINSKQSYEFIRFDLHEMKILQRAKLSTQNLKLC